MDVFFAGENRVAFDGERARLVRLCARLTGDASAAEDLAQDTLVEAWRQRHKLQQPEGRSRWLSAIARHVCRRWLSRRTWDSQPYARQHENDPGEIARITEDLDTDLLRQERVAPLNRTLDTLSPTTRILLLARYADDASLSEIADRTGLSEGAIKVRLHRARRHLRQMLDAQSRVAPLGGGWEETRIWCPACGRGRLLGRLDRPHGSLAFRCPCCDPEGDDTFCEFPLANRTFGNMIGGLVRYKSAFARTQVWVNAYYRPGLARGHVPCTNCGRSVALHRDGSAAGSLPRIVIHCPGCGELGSVSLGGLVLTLPPVRRFWRERQRVRLLPARSIEVDGQPALVSRVEGIADHTYLDVISARDTYVLIAVHGNGAGIDPCR